MKILIILLFPFLCFGQFEDDLTMRIEVLENTPIDIKELQNDVSELKGKEEVDYLDLIIDLERRIIFLENLQFTEPLNENDLLLSNIQSMEFKDFSKAYNYDDNKKGGYSMQEIAKIFQLEIEAKKEKDFIEQLYKIIKEL